MKILFELNAGTKLPPTYLIYGDADDKVDPPESTIQMLADMSERGMFRDGVDAEVEVRQGADHAFDEVPEEECLAFRDWLGKNLF